MPSIPDNAIVDTVTDIVLNLVISGMPSILRTYWLKKEWYFSFKPCYKWNAFNTTNNLRELAKRSVVLNLVISGMPSIRKRKRSLLWSL